MNVNSPLPNIEISGVKSSHLLAYDEATKKWVNLDGKTLPVVTSGKGLYDSGQGTTSEPLNFVDIHTDGTTLSGVGTNASPLQSLQTGDGTTISSNAPWSVINLPTYSGDGTTISTASPFSSLQVGDGTTISTNAPWSVINLPTYAGDGTTISTASPFSVLKPNNMGNYCFVTPQTYGASPIVTVSNDNNAWTVVPMGGGTSSGNQFANDGSYDNSTSTWTCPASGYYHLGMSMTTPSMIGSFHWGMGFSQNSESVFNSYLGEVQNYFDASANLDQVETLSVVAYISAGTTIQCMVWHNGGSTYGFYGNYFSAMRLN